jgi:hypothetical protein
MGVAVLDGCLYVVGGTNRHHEVLQSVERYSFEEVLVFSIKVSYPFSLACELNTYFSTL